jgi:uncharacterized protein YfdQ (DUF2303 family)
MTDKNVAETVAELTRAGAPPQVLSAKDGREFLVLPQGMSKFDIPEEYGLKRSEPLYLAQDVTLQAVDSLVDYVKRFMTADTMLFANIAANEIVAALDYHSASVKATATETEGNSPVAPKVHRVAHLAAMVLPFSEEWKTWSAIDDKLMSALEFARFLEENACDVTAPTGADLLEIARDLQVSRKVNFTQAVRTSTDSENFEYKVESDVRSGANSGVEVPTKFKLELPVYFGESLSELYAYLRWNIGESGALKLGVKLSRAEYVRQAVFKQIVLAVGDKTGCPVVFGLLDD